MPGSKAIIPQPAVWNRLPTQPTAGRRKCHRVIVKHDAFQKKKTQTPTVTVTDSDQDSKVIDHDSPTPPPVPSSHKEWEECSKLYQEEIDQLLLEDEQKSTHLQHASASAHASAHASAPVFDGTGAGAGASCDDSSDDDDDDDDDAPPTLTGTRLSNTTHVRDAWSDDDDNDAW